MTKAPAESGRASARNDGRTSADLAPVFVHSGYRTSSTWFWSKFRQDPHACAYYEPFNPLLADLTGDGLTSIRGGMWRSHHPLSAPYMTEYGILLCSEPGVPLFPSGDQDGERFIGAAGIEGPLDADVEAYVAKLIAVSQGLGRVPVLACTRTLGRVAGFRKALRGHHILLIRNLFQQWCSYSGQLRFGNDYFFTTLFQSMRASERSEFVAYLANFFSEDERADFPTWSRRENHDRIFCYFVAFQTYLLMIARRHVDLVVDANRLARSGPKHRAEVADHVAKLTGLEIDLGEARERIDYPLEQIRSADDCRMLLQTMLNRLFLSEARDDEDRRFVESLIGDMWEEQARFSTMTSGAAEVIALCSAEAANEREHRREAEERAAEESARLADLRSGHDAHLAALNEQLSALKERLATDEREHRCELEEQHRADAKAHAEQLANALETTSDLVRRLDQSEQAILKVLAETISVEDHAAQMAEARDVRRDLARRLDRAEEARLHAHTEAAGLRAELKSLARQLEDTRAEAAAARAQNAAALEDSRDEAGRARLETINLSHQLADATTQGDALAGELAEARRQAAQEAEALHAEMARLHAHIAWRERQLQHADHLLAAVPEMLSGKTGPARLLGRMAIGKQQIEHAAEHAASVAHWRAGATLPQAPGTSQSEQTSPGSSLPTATAPLMHGGIDMMDGDEPITSVPKLLEPHDRHFIHTAYQAVLGRAPDPEGEIYYLTRLRGGTHKLAILRELRRSPEGRAFVPGVAGLDRAIKRYWWATRPVVGVLVRSATGGEGNSTMERQMRALTNEVGRLRGEMQSYLALLSVANARSRSVVVSTGNRKQETQVQVTEGTPAPLKGFPQTEQSVPLTRRAQLIYAKLAGSKPAQKVI